MGGRGVNDYEQIFMVARNVERYLSLPTRARRRSHCIPCPCPVPPGNQEADALAKICTLATDSSSGHCRLVTLGKRAPRCPERMGYSQRRGVGAYIKGSSSGVSKSPGSSLSIHWGPNKEGTGRVTAQAPFSETRAPNMLGVCRLRLGLNPSLPMWAG